LSVQYAGSSPATVNLPSSFTFTKGNAGTQGFSVTLPSVGSYTISATGTASDGTSISGSSTFVVLSSSSNSAGTTLVSNAQAVVLSSNSSGAIIVVSVNASGPIIATQTSQTVIQSSRRDVLAAGNPATVAVEAETGGSNPAIGLLASSSVQGLQQSPDDAPRADDFFLDEGLLPVMASRRGDAANAGATEAIPWPAAALMSFSEGGVWGVIATFLPDKATGQSNRPGEGWKDPPFKANELDDILRERNAPKMSAPARIIDPNAGSYLPPEDNGRRTVAVQDADSLPAEIAVGWLPGAPNEVLDPPQADRSQFFAEVTAGAATHSAHAATSERTAGMEARDWVSMVAAALFAVGVTSLCAGGYDPAVNDREELSAVDLANRDRLG
jgi:hypothetical protein